MHTQLAGLVELLCDLNEVRAADEANDDLLAEVTQGLLHLGRDVLV